MLTSAKRNFKYCHIFLVHKSLLCFYLISWKWYIFSFHFAFAPYSYNILLRQICKTNIKNIWNNAAYLLITRKFSISVCLIFFCSMKADPLYCSLNDRYNSVSLFPGYVPHSVTFLRAWCFLKEEESSDQPSTIGLQITSLTNTIIQINPHNKVIQLLVLSSKLQSVTQKW